MNTVTIENKAELIGFLRGIGTECRFVTLDTETKVENMPKTGNPYWGTVKVCRRNGFVNASFVQAVQKRYAELHGINPKNVTYTPGEVWYRHCMTGEGKPLCLCEHKKKPEQKYMQIFPLRNLGETIYVHPTLGKLSQAQVKDMESRMYENNSPEWKPAVITLAIDSIRSVTFRQIKLLNDTVSRLADGLARFKGLRVSTRRRGTVAIETEHPGWVGQRGGMTMDGHCPP